MPSEKKLKGIVTLKGSKCKFGKKIVEIIQTYYMSDLMIDWMFDLLQYQSLVLGTDFII